MTTIVASNGDDRKEGQLTHQDVHALAIRTLEEHLTLVRHGEKGSPKTVLEVLLSAAAKRSSIEAECEEHPRAPCPNTIRSVLEDSLELSRTEEQLNAALVYCLNPRHWKHPQTVAVDFVKFPYYGQVDIEGFTRRSEAERGTSYFFVYATAYVVREGRRVTLALHFVRQGESLVETLEALYSRLKAIPIRVGRWLADRAFYGAECLRWFGRFALAIVPVPKRGRVDPPGGTRVFFLEKQSRWVSYTLNRGQERELTIDVAVVRRRPRTSRTHRRTPRPMTLVYAVVGYFMQRSGPRPSFDAVVAAYRRRFGIESSYRQMNQARFRTTSRSPALRLLAVGIALLLRNLWALVSWMLAARPHPGRRAHRYRLRLKTLLEWIAHVVDLNLGCQLDVPLPAPTPTRF